MNFFDTQERSHRNTRKLVLLMTLAVVVVVVSVTAVVIVAIWIMISGNIGRLSLPDWLQRNPYTPLGIAGGTALLIGLASLHRIAGLRQGGSRVARDLGGTQLAPADNDPLHRRLRNVVEEMAIASGVPAPEIFVLEHESGINAFAAGYRPEDAAVAVTRGALESLSRDELQGVIAHEFSHVLNGDMRLNIKLMGPMFGILAIGLLGRMLLRSGRLSSRRSRGNSPAIALGAGLAIVGSIGVLLARLIKAGVSRQREYLADASAVQFTRQTEGLAGALKKIGGLAESSHIQHAATEEVSHMLFATGLPGIASWFATHPPLLERIQALEPAFTATQFKQLHTESIHSSPSDLPGVSGFADNQSAYPEVTVTDTESVLRTIGNPDDRHFDLARDLHDQFPTSIRDALESHYEVMLLVPALILHADEEIRQGQLALLTQQLGADRCEKIAELYRAIARLGVAVRLPLLDLALPLVKERPAIQLEFLSKLLHQLATQDHELELFEYALLRVFDNYINTARAPAQRRRWLSLDDPKMQQAAAELLQVFALLGHDDDASAQDALETGLAHLGATLTQPSPAKDWAASCDAALATLLHCTPKDRQIVVRALISTTLHDGRISLAESELLRAFCGILECPLPPLLAAH